MCKLLWFYLLFVKFQPAGSAANAPVRLTQLALPHGSADRPAVWLNQLAQPYGLVGWRSCMAQLASPAERGEGQVS